MYTAHQTRDSNGCWTFAIDLPGKAPEAGTVVEADTPDGRVSLTVSSAAPFVSRYTGRLTVYAWRNRKGW